jgi:hypothetical protein
MPVVAIMPQAGAWSLAMGAILASLTFLDLFQRPSILIFPSGKAVGTTAVNDRSSLTNLGDIILLLLTGGRNLVAKLWRLSVAHYGPMPIHPIHTLRCSSVGRLWG